MGIAPLNTVYLNVSRNSYFKNNVTSLSSPNVSGFIIVNSTGIIGVLNVNSNWPSTFQVI